MKVQLVEPRDEGCRRTRAWQVEQLVQEHQLQHLDAEQRVQLQLAINSLHLLIWLFVLFVWLVCFGWLFKLMGLGPTHRVQLRLGVYV